LPKEAITALDGIAGAGGVAADATGKM